MDKICELKECTGCHACYSACPKQCITMEKDEYGFLYPVIDQNKCINCNRCRQVCPVNNKVNLKEPLSTYAAINNNQYDYETTTSGGIATVFSKQFLEAGGIVYGVAIDAKSLHNRHVRITTLEEADNIKGSKYIQSEIGNMFRYVKRDLEQKKSVLFTGTPCQVAGLKKYLIKEYENLFTVDIICHGVPSEQFLKEHLKAVGIEGEIDALSFREREGYYLSIYKNGQSIYRKSNFFDIFYLGFLKALFHRTCCYTCRYANRNRCSDVTLGDFWGFDETKGKFPVKAYSGLSCVLANTEKGQKLFGACSKKMIYVERELEEAVAGNKQLRHPSQPNRNCGVFKKKYNKLGFEKASKRALWKERAIYAILDKISR